MIRGKKGFTLIEVLLLIVLVALFIPFVARFFGEHTRAITLSDNLAQAVNVARFEMAKINNLDYTDATLADAYDVTTSNYQGYNLDLRREVDIVAGTSNNLKKVEVTVYDGGTTTQLAKLAGYVASVTFGPGSSGGGVGAGDQADSFSLSGGKIDKKKLKDIITENTGGSGIVLTIVKVTFTGASGIKLKKIKFDNTEHWSGSAASGDVITLDSSFSMSAGTSYTKHKIEFTKKVSTVTVDYYEFEDGTQTGSYSWP